MPRRRISQAHSGPHGHSQNRKGKYLLGDQTVSHLKHSVQERVINSNGYFKFDTLGRGLVNGRLAMTRSLGDLDLKPFGVIAQPDTRSFEVGLV